VGVNQAEPAELDRGPAARKEHEPAVASGDPSRAGRMRRYKQQAEQALYTGDTATARAIWIRRRNKLFRTGAADRRLLHRWHGAAAERLRRTAGEGCC
jgi:hypothetical protein